RTRPPARRSPPISGRWRSPAFSEEPSAIAGVAGVSSARDLAENGQVGRPPWTKPGGVYEANSWGSALHACRLRALRRSKADAGLRKDGAGHLNGYSPWGSDDPHRLGAHHLGQWRHRPRHGRLPAEWDGND